MIAVAGELDAGVTNPLSRWFEGSVAVDSRSAIIDLEHLAFLDAGGIAVFVSLGLRLTHQKRTLSLRKPQPIVRRVIAIGGLLPLTESIHVAHAGDFVLRATSRHVP